MGVYNWKKIASKIGPLRYQASESDCVPITISNAMLFLMQKRLHPRLLHMIWSISVESKKGTGWVTSNTLSDILNSWFKLAHEDGYEEDILPFESRIIEDDAVHLRRNNAVVRTLNAGGVCCITVRGGTHYVLLHATEGTDFLGFDPYWRRSYGTENAKIDFAPYFGLVNTRYRRDELEAELANDYNKWLHAISTLHAEDVG